MDTESSGRQKYNRMEEAETEWCSLEIGGNKQNVQSEKA